MMVLGSVYFRKLLEVCDFAYLESYAELVRPVLSAASGTEYVLSQKADSQQMERWSKGVFNQPSERTLRFPRVIYGFRPVSGDADERWRVTVFFTPIPHINGSYGNKRTKHTMAAPVEKELGTRLVESCLADTFDLKTSNTMVGSEAGLYLHLKVRSIPLLRKRFEDGKYTPPGSELRELLEILPAILPETGPSSTVLELQNKRSHRKEFLDKGDKRIVAALGKERLATILTPTGISADKWLSAGKRSLW
jgi:hypothetical protein